VDPSQISNLILGILGAVSILGARLTTNGRKRARELRALRSKFEDLEGHAFDCRRMIRRLGGTPPTPPASLADMDAEEE